MPQFLIMATDFADEQCLERRMKLRTDHLARMKLEKLSGNFIVGGATLNSKGQMNGSVLVVNMANEDLVTLWIQEDPYTVGKVWDKVAITPFKVAEV